MNVSDVNDSLEHMDLPAHQKRSILQVIDVKIANDMKEVIAKIEQLEKLMEARFQVVEDKIQMTNEKIQLVHDKLSNEIKTVYWVVGIAMTVIVFMVARK